MAKFNFHSRYRKTDKIIVDDIETVGTWSQPSYLIERPSDKFIFKYAVTSATEARPDLIAKEIYGAADLDWVLVAFNGPAEVLNWPTSGTTIDYPSKDLVMAEL
jgi:hypothetical protein